MNFVFRSTDKTAINLEELAKPRELSRCETDLAGAQDRARAIVAEIATIDSSAKAPSMIGEARRQARMAMRRSELVQEKDALDVKVSGLTEQRNVLRSAFQQAVKPKVLAAHSNALRRYLEALNEVHESFRLVGETDKATRAAGLSLRKVAPPQAGRASDVGKIVQAAIAECEGKSE